MSGDGWTLERIVLERPGLAGLARVHAVLEGALGAAAAQLPPGALVPRFQGPPAVQWVGGRCLFDACRHERLAEGVARLFHAAARALAVEVSDASAALEETCAAAPHDGFPWAERIAGFRELPSARDAPHPELFRFLLGRSLARPLASLAAAHSAPHPERWLPAACPWCGIPAAAQLATPGSSRRLLCVLCGGRWRTADLACPACGEERADRFLVVAGPQAGPASLEACATCRTALKVFAGALLPPQGAPLACEVLTIALDVHAEAEQGLVRDPAALAVLFPPR